LEGIGIVKKKTGGAGGGGVKEKSTNLFLKDKNNIWDVYKKICLFFFSF